MKSVIIADPHDKDPLELVRALLDEDGVERAVFLGDYDNPKMLEEILKLDMEKIVIIGNHDYHMALGHGLNGSNSLVMPFEKYVALWNQHPIQKQFVLDAAKMNPGDKSGLKVVQRVDGGNIVYVHAALVDDSLAEGKIPELWGRMVDYDTHFTQRSRLFLNFEEMRRQNFWIMFRGHDHIYGMASLAEGGDSNDVIEFGGNREHNLRKDTRYIVSVGDFERGRYALFDDKEMKIELRGGS